MRPGLRLEGFGFFLLSIHKMQLTDPLSFGTPAESLIPTSHHKGLGFRV